jgi:hypothetical protein
MDGGVAGQTDGAPIVIADASLSTVQDGMAPTSADGAPGDGRGPGADMAASGEDAGARADATDMSDAMPAVVPDTMPAVVPDTMPAAVPDTMPAVVPDAMPAPAPMLTVSPASWDFGSLPAGTTTGATVVFTVTNVGTGTARALIVAPTGPDGEFFSEPGYPESNTCRGKDLAPGGTCAFNWTFIPNNPAAPPGLRTNDVLIGANGGPANQKVTLKLTGTVTGAQALCTSGEKRCLNGTPQTCDGSGHWQSGAACSGATPTCSEGNCIGSGGGSCALSSCTNTTFTYSCSTASSSSKTDFCIYFGNPYPKVVTTTFTNGHVVTCTYDQCGATTHGSCVDDTGSSCTF